MHRWARALPSALALLAISASVVLAAGPPFPDPVPGQAVYDTAGMLSAEVIAELEQLIEAMEADVGAEMVVYTQHSPDISEDENLDNARALIDQWRIGRAGFDDGIVLMIGLDPDPGESRVSLYGGSGFVSAYASPADLKAIIDDVFVPLARNGHRERAVVETVEAVSERTSPAVRAHLERMRMLNAAVGIVGAPMALLITLGIAWRRWKREGDDPELIDSPSILMAGPPAGMTPPLATVVRAGTAGDHAINTILVELASTGRLTFHNLDKVRSARSDGKANPATDPAIGIHQVGDDDRLAGPQREAWKELRRLAGSSDRLTRSRLWKVNARLEPLRARLEDEAVRLGWFTRAPTPQITRMTATGVGIGVLGAGVTWIGIAVPMSGAVLLGAALVLGGVATIGFGRAMSQRTYQGAYVDAMLKAYRRTLKKTMEQARSMGQVVEEPEVAVLADTPDKAVVWGIALGLHDEVARVLKRGLEDQRRATGSPADAYYPAWLGGTSDGTGRAAAGGGGTASGVRYGSGSVFAGSAIPDIGGMVSALGRVGATPPSSSSSSGSGGGGFSGGGSSGGGGASGSF